MAGADHRRLALVDPAAREQAAGVVARVVHGVHLAVVAREQHQTLADLQAAQLAVLEVCRPQIDPVVVHGPRLHQANRVDQRLLCDYTLAMRKLLAVSLLSLAACSHNLIPGTDIPDRPDTRAVIDVFAKYKLANEARDANAIFALTAPSYFDEGDVSHARAPMDYEGMKKKVSQDLSAVKSIRLDLTVRDLKVEGSKANIDYFATVSYAVAVPTGERWKRESDDARLRLLKIGGAWKIVAGL